MSTAISSRVAALEARVRGKCISYIINDPSGDVLMVDQRPDEAIDHLQRRVRDEWLAGGHDPQHLPPECQAC